MEGGLIKASNIVGHVMVQKRYRSFAFFILFNSSSFQFFLSNSFFVTFNFALFATIWTSVR
jgi:hypothetical protein